MTPYQRMQKKAARLQGRAPKLSEVTARKLIEAVVYVAENGDMRENARLCFVCREAMDRIDSAVAALEMT